MPIDRVAALAPGGAALAPVTLQQCSEALATRRVSSVELTRWTLERIRRLNPSLNAIISLCEESALEEAQAADQAIARGQGGRLTGVPIAHKDIFCTRKAKTTCGSRMLADWVAPYDATVVERLRCAGMVGVAKTNMDEFAMGSSNENSYFGPVHNPWDRARVSGGSSGGSAAAVAAGLVAAATGTDTGGSIRQPAAMCGVTGIKPTYGRVSRYGMVAFASSLDQAGVFARSAQDCALVLQTMAGHDPRDSTSADHPVEDYPSALRGGIRGLRVGVVEAHFGEGLDRSIAAAIEGVMDTLRGLGARIVPVEMPHGHLAIPAYYVIASAECSSNLSRFDGVRFGHRAAGARDLQEMYRRTRSEGFGTEVKRRIMLGTYALSTGYYDAYYLRAQRVRRLVAEDFRRAFASVDLLLGPTSPSVAFRLGERLDDPLTMYYSDIYTIGANLAGLPALSMPAGFSGGLPVGCQLIGDHFSEARLLHTAHAYQQATDWHLREPPGFEVSAAEAP